MGADSGSFVGSTSGSFFDSSNASNSNCSAKSRQGTSSSSSSNHNYGNLFGGGIREKNKLLNSKIIEINIGIEPIGPKIGHFFTNNFIVNQQKVWLPSHLGGSTFCHHLSCLLTLSNSESLILEFGAYYGKEPSYKNNIYYWKIDGLRFCKMTYSEYQDKIGNGIYGGGILENSELTFENKMTLKELILKCCNEGKWRANDYNLASNNCQDFIAKVIEILNVKRIYSFSHNFALTQIPPCILKELEKNEDRKVLRFFEKIPILGVCIEEAVLTADNISYTWKSLLSLYHLK